MFIHTHLSYLCVSRLQPSESLFSLLITLSVILHFNVANVIFEGF